LHQELEPKPPREGVRGRERIHHPIEAPLGLGSRVEGEFLVSMVWGEREHGRE